MGWLGFGKKNEEESTDTVEEVVEETTAEEEVLEEEETTMEVIALEDIEGDGTDDNGYLNYSKDKSVAFLDTSGIEDVYSDFNRGEVVSEVISLLVKNGFELVQYTGDSAVLKKAQ